MGTDPVAIEMAVADAMSGTWGPMERPKYWDGHAARRIVLELETIFQLSKIRFGADMNAQGPTS